MFPSGISRTSARACSAPTSATRSRSRASTPTRTARPTTRCRARSYVLPGRREGSDERARRARRLLDAVPLEAAQEQVVGPVAGEAALHEVPGRVAEAERRRRRGLGGEVA